MSYQELLFSPIVPSKIVTVIEKASTTGVPVLILGEQGAGKELIAKIIHHTGPWKTQRFSKIDCKFLTEDSFQQRLSQLLREVDYGTPPATLYFKEVGALDPISQLHLLELVEDGVFQNGAEKKGVKDLRFIFSSSEDLSSKVSQGKFSEDLYDRLSTLSIMIPPLRHRTKEIPAIAQFMLAEYSRKMKIKTVTISPGAQKLLESYWWPGNLRELEHLILRSSILSEGDTLTEQDLFIQIENEKHPFLSFLKRGGLKISPSPKEPLPEEPADSQLPLFFIDLIHRVKNPLVSIKTFTQLLREKFGDAEFREYFYRIVTEDIDKIDHVLNGLLSYIKINTPIKKANTVNLILQEIIRKYEAQLEERRVKIFKKFEKDLPETTVHDEHLRYILDSILQYALPSIPPEGSIGFLTKSSDLRTRKGDLQAVVQKDDRSIEVLIVFSGYRKLGEPFEAVLGVSTSQPREAFELELRLVQEIIHRNQGVMTYEVNEKKPRTLIALRFPVERRNVFYYSSTRA